MISAGTSSRFVAMRRKPSLSTPEEPPLYFPFEMCGLMYLLNNPLVAGRAVRVEVVEGLVRVRQRLLA